MTAPHLRSFVTDTPSHLLAGTAEIGFSLPGAECVNSTAGCRVGSARAGTDQPVLAPRSLCQPLTVVHSVSSAVPQSAPQGRPPCPGAQYLFRALAAAGSAVPAAHPASCVPPVVSLNQPQLQPRGLCALNAGRAGLRGAGAGAGAGAGPGQVPEALNTRSTCGRGLEVSRGVTDP